MTKHTKRRAGRPPLPPDEKLGYRLNLYLHNATGDRLEALAQRNGQTLASLVRELLASGLEARP